MSYMYRLVFGRFGGTNLEQLKMATILAKADPTRIVLLQDNVSDRAQFDAEPRECDNHGVKGVNFLFFDSHVSLVNNAVRQQRNIYYENFYDTADPPPDPIEKALFFSQVGPSPVPC